MSRGEHARSWANWLLALGAAVVLPLLAGFGFARLFAPTLHSRYFPWLSGRALGISAYLALTALVLVGIWTRHPWRQRMAVLHPEARLRLHAALATASVALVGGHLAFLASDKYAGVGWVGALVPFEATYRPVAVAFGVVAMLYMVLLTATARLAGRWGARHWHLYHHLAVLAFASAWIHGVRAGTDTPTLRWLYVATGALVVVATVTRYAFAQPRRRVPGPEELGASARAALESAP